MKKLDVARLASLADEAAHSPRLRMNHNLHQELADPIQRLAIAMEPGTYIRPHRHLQTWELLTSLQGRFVVLNFDDEGTVIARAVLGEETSVLETPVASWHAVLSSTPAPSSSRSSTAPMLPFGKRTSPPGHRRWMTSRASRR